MNSATSIFLSNKSSATICRHKHSREVGGGGGGGGDERQDQYAHAQHLRVSVSFLGQALEVRGHWLGLIPLQLVCVCV